MLLNIYQKFGDELTGGPAASIPRAHPAAAEWKQAEGVRWSVVMESELRVPVLL